MARAITSPELSLLRGNGQFTHLKLAFPISNIVFAASIHENFTSVDSITQITYWAVTEGSYTDIISGMTVWIGTAPNTHDIGICRVRKAATNSILYIGETSEVQFAIDQYITVLNDYGVWPRHLAIDSNKLAKMDFDIPYTDQHTNTVPVVVIGPDAVVEIIDGSATLQRTSNRSWYINDSDVVVHTGMDYEWTCSPVCTDITDPFSDTPTFHFEVPGTYTIICKASISETRFSYGYRKVVVYNDVQPLATAFEISGNPTGSKSDGGWQFSVRMIDEAYRINVYDRAMVILVAEDEMYNNTNNSLGPVVGSENVICVGWITEESIVYNIELGEVSFTVRSSEYWLKQETCFPLGIENTTGTADAWTNIKNITTDKMLWHLIVWRSTLALCVDCQVTEDPRYSPGFEAVTGTMWQQIATIAETSIFAYPCCDRYGRLFISIDPQYRTYSARSAIPVVMTLTREDYADSIRTIRNIFSAVSKVYLSGISYVAGVANSFFSLAPGHVFKRVGAIENVEKILLLNQTQANLLSGMYIANKNNEYPSFNLTLQSNNRFIDICPNQYVGLNIDGADSPRGEPVTMNTIPREVSLLFDEDSSSISVSLNLEGASVYTPGITGDTPPVPPTPPIVHIPRIHVPPPFPKPPEHGTMPATVFILTEDAGVFYTQNFGASDPTWAPLAPPVDPATVTMMVLDKLAKMIYVGGALGIWGGPADAPTLAPFIDDDWLSHEFPGMEGDSPPRVGMFGINTSFADCMLVIAGTDYLSDPAHRKAYAYFGAPNALVRKCEIGWGAVQFSYGEVTYGENYWIYTSAGFVNRPSWGKLTADAATLIESHEFEDPYIGHWHIRLGVSSRIYFSYWNATPGYSADNMTSVEALPHVSSRSAYPGSIIFNSDSGGSHLMSVSYLGILQRSSDSGATWTDVDSIPEGYIITAIECLNGFANTWIVAGRLPITDAPPLVMYSANFGDSWTDKTGDLATLYPLAEAFRKIIGTS